MKRRIKDTPIHPGCFKGSFYDRYRKPIDYYFGESKEEDVYIPDYELEQRIWELLHTNKNSLIYYRGKAGIGKTTLLKRLLQITDNTVRIDEDNHMLYLSVDFRGQIAERDVEKFWINCIVGFCSELEEKYEFDSKFYSVEEHLKFYEFVKRNANPLLGNVKAVELVGLSELDGKLLRLRRAEECKPYEYYSIRLMYYIAHNFVPINRICIVVDNIEALTDESSSRAVKAALAFFSELLNVKNNVNEKKLILKLLISVRRTTYETLMRYDNIRAYQPYVYEDKVKVIDIAAYVLAKKDILEVPQEEIGLWDEAYQIIAALIHRFSRKYANLITNLCNGDFQMMKKCYKKILTNQVWLLNNDRKHDFLSMSNTDSLFNNISVIRSIGCGNNGVYRGIKCNVLPNVLLNDEFHDDSVMSLLILGYFVRKGKIIEQEKIRDINKNIFCDSQGINDSINRVITYYYKHGILETFNDDGIEKIVVTPRGSEIWNMFVTDSVLLEMYREDYYFDSESDKSNYTSSFSMMGTVGQVEIFFQLFMFIEVLLREEKKIHQMVRENNMLEEYYSCFGRKLMTKRLLEGVIKSVQYSGNMYVFGMQNAIDALEYAMKKIDQN